MRFLLVSIVLFISISVKPQSRKVKIQGKIVDSKSFELLEKSHVVLNNKYITSSDTNGIFYFEVELAKSLIFVQVTYIGYRDTIIAFELNEYKEKAILPPIKLKKASINLAEVEITAKVDPVKIKGDTIQFNASAYKIKPNSSAKELVEILPGMSRDREGNLIALGKKVEVVLVDDRIFYKEIDETLESIPANIVGNVQVYDALSDIAEFTGFDDGDRTTTINLNTKYKNLTFGTGNTESAYGSGNHYSIEGIANIFLGAARFSLMGGMNNINKLVNKDEFALHEQMGLTGEGLHKRSRIGSGFSLKNKSIDLFSAFSFNRDANYIDKLINRTYYKENRKYTKHSTSNIIHKSYDYNTTLKTQIGRRNKLFFTPAYIYSNTFLDSYDTVSNLKENIVIGNSISHNTNNQGTHQFIGKLTWLTILSKSMYLESHLMTDIKRGNEKKNSIGYVNNLNTTYSDLWETRSDKASYQMSLTKMFSKNSGIDLKIQSIYFAEKFNNNFQNLSLNYLNSNIGLEYSLINDKLEITTSCFYQNTKTIKSELKKEFNDIKLNFELSYYGGFAPGDKMYLFRITQSTQSPFLNQLYSIENKQTPLTVNIGNLDLQNNISTQIYANFTLCGKMLNRFSIVGNITSNKNAITNAITLVDQDTQFDGIEVKKGSQLVSYVNMPGNWNYTLQLTKSFSLNGKSNKVSKALKNFFLYLKYDYNKYPSIYNNTNLISHINSVDFFSSMRLNGKKINMAVGNNVSHRWSSNSLNQNKNYSWYNRFNIEIAYTFFKKCFFKINGSLIYEYIQQQKDKHLTYTVLNSELGLRLINEKLEFTVKGFDLLNQNQTRMTGFFDSYSEVKQINNLRRFFMFSLKFHFNALNNGNRIMFNKSKERIKSF